MSPIPNATTSPGAGGSAETTATRISALADTGTWATVRRGLTLSPEFRRGIGVTILVSLLGTAGRVVVPVAIQQIIDRALLAEGGPDTALVLRLVALCGLGAVITALASYVMSVRVFRASEAGLATLRITAFRHLHDLSVLTQNTERRGALVARVTADVDTISTFVQWGGMLLVSSIGQLTVATVIMAVYSWPLTLLVWAVYLPVFWFVRRMQRVVSRAYARVRERLGDVLAGVSESVVGAETIRAYAVESRTQTRIDAAIEGHRKAATRAQVLVASTFTVGFLVSGLVVALVVLAGAWLGADGRLTLGRLLAFLFLLQLFTAPVQMGAEVLNELQNAVAGWRRVIAVIDTPADVADPGEDGERLPAGAARVVFEDVGYHYPDGPPVLTGVNLVIEPGHHVAVVGETGSGKTTLARLLTRLMDPVSGRVTIDGIDLRRVRFDSLRSGVVLVPQEGFLIDGTLLENLQWGVDGVDALRARRVVSDLGLDAWLAGLPRGLQTPVGPRGEALSAGERQLVAVVRAALGDPDLLVLDEATSSVDPSTEAALQRALVRLSRGRTAVTIAHRLSTAESADLVVVVEEGRIVDAAPHPVVLQRCAAYQRLHASWTAQLSA